MHPAQCRSSLAVVTCAAALLLTAGPAPAQSPGYEPERAVVRAVPSRYWGYTYTPYSPLSDAANAVRAGAAYLRAEGDFMIKKQETNLLRLEVREKWLDVHRKELEHFQWVREFKREAMLAEEENYRKGQVEYNRRFPPVAEILTAVPLNSLLDELKGRGELPAAGSEKIEDDCLLHISVSAGARGNAAMLKRTTIVWPQLLLRGSFREDRDRIGELLAQGKTLALGKTRDQEKMAEVLVELRKAVRICQTRLDKEIRADLDDPDCNPCRQIETMKFLHDVVDTVFVLKRSDAATYFAAPEGKTVAELAAYMRKNGLKFAPAAVDEDERFYVALHRAMALEVTRLKNQDTPSSR